LAASQEGLSSVSEWWGLEQKKLENFTLIFVDFEGVILFIATLRIQRILYI
jgi:hypothetical protein